MVAEEVDRKGRLGTKDVKLHLVDDEPNSSLVEHPQVSGVTIIKLVKGIMSVCGTPCNAFDLMRCMSWQHFAH